MNAATELNAQGADPSGELHPKPRLECVVKDVIGPLEHALADVEIGLELLVKNVVHLCTHQDLWIEAPGGTTGKHAGTAELGWSRVQGQLVVWIRGEPAHLPGRTLAVGEAEAEGAPRMNHDSSVYRDPVLARVQAH